MAVETVQLLILRKALKSTLLPIIEHKKYGRLCVTLPRGIHGSKSQHSKETIFPYK